MVSPFALDKQNQTPRKARIAILGSGSGTNAAAICSFAEKKESTYEVGMIMSTSPHAGICDVAQKYSIPCEILRTDRDLSQQINQILDQYNVEVLALAGFMKLLPPSVIEHLMGRVLNIHPSLLPKHGGKGMYGIHVHEAVLKAGEAVTGATVHVVTNHYDQGRVVAQRALTVPGGIKANELQQLVKRVENQLYPEALEVFLRNS